MSTEKCLTFQAHLDSYITGDDNDDEDFSVANVNLQKASSSESSDSNAAEHCANAISPVPKSGRSCGHGRKQGRRKNYTKSL